MAKYRLNQVSYMSDRLHQVGEEIVVPKGTKAGPHWEPLDDEAKADMSAAKVSYTGEVPDVLSQLEPAYMEALKASGASAPIDGKALAVAFKEAFASMMNPEQKQADFNKAVAEAVALELARLKEEKKGKKDADA